MQEESCDEACRSVVSFSLHGDFMQGNIGDAYVSYHPSDLEDAQPVEMASSLLQQHGDSKVACPSPGT